MLTTEEEEKELGERNAEKMLLVGWSKDIFQQVRKEQKDSGEGKKK